MAEPKKGKEEKMAKRPSALKRDMQNQKRRLRNRSYRSQVQTAIRSLTDALAKKEPKEIALAKLNEVYSLMDKGVNKGVFKINKASRTKARLAAHISA